MATNSHFRKSVRFFLGVREPLVRDDLLDSNFERVEWENRHCGGESVGKTFFITGDKRFDLGSVEHVVDSAPGVTRWQR